jgi:hypothetical protein
VTVDVVVALLGGGVEGLLSARGASSLPATSALEAGIRMRKRARREKKLDANLVVAARCRRRLGGRDIARKGRRTGAKWKTQGALSNSYRRIALTSGLGQLAISHGKLSIFIDFATGFPKEADHVHGSDSLHEMQPATCRVGRSQRVPGAEQSLILGSACDIVLYPYVLVTPLDSTDCTL